MNLQQMLDQALAFHRSGRTAEAERLYSRILAAVPDNAVLHFNHGSALRELRRHDAALASFDKALSLQPDFAAALHNRSLCLQDLGRFDEALASFGKTLVLTPQDANILLNQGLILFALKRFKEALTSFDRALVLAPRDLGALNNRGLALMEMARFEEALAGFEAALAVSPGQVEVLNNIGLALAAMNRFAPALASYGAALAINPRHAGVLNNRGLALAGMQRPAEALESFEAALAIDPDYDDALCNRGRQLLLSRRFGDALADYEKALAINPRHPDALGGVAEAALRLCDWPRMAALEDRIRAGIGSGTAAIPPFVLLGYSGDAALQLQCARNFTRHQMPVTPRALSARAPHRNPRIRIAYLSAIFHRHPTASLIAELFERHDRTRFEVAAISFGPDDGSEMRARLTKAFDQFVDVRGRGDAEIAHLLWASKTDIAIDLDGHTQNSRPGILSYRPAPVQVNYLGYPGTIGAEFIDYVIADPVIAPFGQADCFSEKIVQLPDCYQANDARRAIGEQTPSRQQAGLPAQGFVFCCFNNNWKITAAVFEVWMRLLAAVPGSVLWLFDGGTSAQLRAAAAARGIDPQRLIFASRVAPAEHLARHRLADLFLDTLPYNAHTTASDALWAGLPLVTAKGEAFAGRVAASLLGAVGLPELVTRNLQEYEMLALKLAQDRALLQSIRQKLAQNRLTSPLFDSTRFRKNIEAAYIKMWELAESGAGPQSFRVEV